MSRLPTRLVDLLPRLAVAAVSGLFVLVVGCSAVMWFLARGSVVAVSAGEDVPDAPAIIVPGARVFPSGRPSAALADRLDVAGTAIDAGWAAHVLVSGDNRSDRYNEPEAMQAYLLGLGVNAEQITMDFAGLDTWDTCIRARNQFGVTEAIFVTQAVYANRAASLCQAAGIDVTVVTVEEPNYGARRRLAARVRETLAGVKAVGDIVRKPASHYEGPFVGLVASDTQLAEIADAQR